MDESKMLLDEYRTGFVLGDTMLRRTSNAKYQREHLLWHG